MVQFKRLIKGHLETCGEGPNLLIALPKKNRSQVSSLSKKLMKNQLTL